MIASLQLRQGARPEAATVQMELARSGVQIYWFDDLPETHPGFAAIQVAATNGWYPARYDDLHAAPDSPVTRGEAARALAAKGKLAGDPVKAVVEKDWMAVDHRNWFHEDLPLYWTDIRIPGFQPAAAKKSGPVTRAEFFLALMK